MHKPKETLTLVAFGTFCIYRTVCITSRTTYEMFLLFTSFALFLFSNLLPLDDSISSVLLDCV